MILVYSTVEHFTFFCWRKTYNRRTITQKCQYTINILYHYCNISGNTCPQSSTDFQVFLKYGATLGLMINSSKRKFYSGMKFNTRVNCIMDTLGFSKGSIPLNYIGCSIFWLRFSNTSWVIFLRYIGTKPIFMDLTYVLFLGLNKTYLLDSMKWQDKIP